MMPWKQWEPCQQNMDQECYDDSLLGEKITNILHFKGCLFNFCFNFKKYEGNRKCWRDDKGIDHQWNILRLLHTCLTPMYSSLFYL